MSMIESREVHSIINVGSNWCFIKKKRLKIEEGERGGIFFSLCKNYFCHVFSIIVQK